MDKEPCSITDDPFNDYSDYIEGQGVYKNHWLDEEEEEDE